MKFVNAKKLTEDALKRGYAVPAFNTNGGAYDITRAALEAAEETKSPLILQVYEPNVSYRGFEYFVKLATHLYDELNISVPVALQVDHGHSLETLLRAMKAGLTSVMIDASHEPLEVNIAISNEVVKIAHALGCSVEAEVGYVKGNEPPSTSLVGRTPIPQKPQIPPGKSDLNQIKEFLSKVSVDMLAVSVGTTHGVYKEQNEIDFELLSKIRRSVDVPLVQHGTCGISLENLNKLVKHGINKINFGEPFRFNYINYFIELADNMEHLWHPWKIMKEIKEKLKKEMKELIMALESEGKACQK